MIMQQNLPATHVVITEMPMSPAYHTGCLLYCEGEWHAVREIHPMCDLDIDLVKRGVVAFPKLSQELTVKL